MQRSRDHMVQSLQSVGLRPIVRQGSYFLIIDVSDFSEWDQPRWAKCGGLEAARGSAWPLTPREEEAQLARS